MPVTMSGSPTAGSPTGAYLSPSAGSPTGYTGYTRAHRLSPPTSKHEAEALIGWLSVARPHVSSKFDEFVEGEKQWNEKEAMRQKLLDQEAREQQAQAEKEARQKDEWKARMRALEKKEQFEKEFKANERKIILSEWSEMQNQEPGHGPTRWLWPTARDHPRAWVANTDIPLKASDRDQSVAWSGSPGARAKVTLSPALHQMPGF